MTSDAHASHPARIGPYHVIQVIGEGGMGVVYEAEQKEPVRRRVAVKMLRAGLDSKAVIGRFESERQALAVMEHPGIAKVLDAGATEHGRPYFVMELVRGVPLVDYCDRHRFSTRRRVELFIRQRDRVLAVLRLPGEKPHGLPPGPAALIQCEIHPVANHGGGVLAGALEFPFRFSGELREA